MTNEVKKRGIEELVRNGKVRYAIRSCLATLTDLDLNCVESNMVTSYLDECALEVMKRIKLFKKTEDVNAAKIEIREGAKKRAIKDMELRMKRKSFNVRFNKNKPQQPITLENVPFDKKSGMYS